MNGWIKLHRKLLDNPVVCKDSDYLSIWMYLLLNATHSNYDSIFKSKRITLTPGQLITGRKSISTKLKINENKVQRVLKTFENEHQIEQQTSNQNRLITILNWINYQDTEQPIEQQVNNERTTDEQQVNTNKNVKNIKNENNILYDYMVQNSNEIQNNLFDFKILNNQINKCYKTLLEKREVFSYTENDYIEVFKYFYDSYYNYMGHAHPKIKSNYIKDVMEKLPYVDGDIYNNLGEDIDPDDNKTLIDAYFRQPWGKEINPTIIHFISGNIRALRYYETSY